jgi:murein DD-endopeptidase MepM/ murein hydrolase activator NlpD
MYALIICILSVTGCQTGGNRQSGKAAQGLINTGLTPVYPDNAKCPEVVSFFGDRTRYDGSYRPRHANDGFHGGIDITLPIGTPLIAIADGTVIQVAKGGMMVGIKIMLQHSPEDTGLPVWTYTKYQPE